MELSAILSWSDNSCKNSEFCCIESGRLNWIIIRSSGTWPGISAHALCMRRKPIIGICFNINIGCCTPICCYLNRHLMKGAKKVIVITAPTIKICIIATPTVDAANIKYKNAIWLIFLTTPLYIHNDKHNWKQNTWASTLHYLPCLKKDF